MLACSCDVGGSDWLYAPPKDFSELATSRRKRCCSCHTLIDVGATCVSFNRWRDPYSDIEEIIHGSEVWLAPWYMCEWCGEMYFNLDALGYCHYLGDSIQEAMQEYWEMTGYTPVNKRLHTDPTAR